jgi:hypothetical protein
MMLDVSYNIARTTDLQVTKGFAYTPSTFYAGGQQPNTAPSALLSNKITNPFAISNFGGVASSNPAAYKMMQLNSYFTQQQIPISNLVRAYPQMNGLSLNQSLGESHFQEALTATTSTNGDGSTITTCTYSGTGFVTNPACQPTDTTSVSFRPA